MNKTSVRQVISSVLLSAMMIAIYFFGMYVIGTFISNAIAATIVDIIFKIVMGIIAIIITKFVIKAERFSYIKKGLLCGIFIYGAMFLVYTISNLVAGYSTLDRTFIEALPYIVLFLFVCVGIGFAEEILFRGFIFNVMHKLFVNSKHKDLWAILISSVIFGLCHLFNLIATPNMVISTITQVVYATIIGVYFAVIYVKTHNIVATIILHTLFDYVYYIWWAFSNEAIISSTIDITIIQGVVSIAMHLPILIWSILVYKGTFDFDK